MDKRGESVFLEDFDKVISEKLNWEKFAGKTVLITGAAGFLPAYLVCSLLRLNDSKKLSKPVRVLGLVRNIERANKRFHSYLDRSDFVLLEGDVTNSFNMSNESIHFIVHAASQASPKYYGSDPVGTLSANILGTANLLKLATIQPVDCFLFFSSSEIYGQLSEAALEAHESSCGSLDPMNVRSCYSESKRMGETMCVSWWHQYQVPIRVVRPFHTYGPGMLLNDGRVFADFVANVVEGKDITMNSDGSAIRAFCYLVDATIAYFYVMLNGENGQAYNVGNDEEVLSIANLAEKVAQIIPDKQVKVIFNKREETAGYMKSSVNRIVPNVSKLRALGWSPNYDVDSGFRRTILSYL
ncbi:NAD-dependent epimerase/dehydratase family protein [Iodobacter ciconiae]|uniref:NAD-dependent epimerase/dehydratase family protein n=1 Tax=Iodobacter ciconiae TaxID=2496266 RepID=A0A3S8ZWJ7_9NEIS|nr:NAD-dependent epimerase/dehydratase family protein [Iodobacter ciconiae]AZN37856.1 NAD-dependent epimerase/dehydratase family protein [Iodobacter ciconiae]